MEDVATESRFLVGFMCRTLRYHRLQTSGVHGLSVCIKMRDHFLPGSDSTKGDMHGLLWGFYDTLTDLRFMF